MSDPVLTFDTFELKDDYSIIPVDLQDELTGHFTTLRTAPCMRKLPYPAHANRGVTIRVENYEAKVSVHAARTPGLRTIEVLGLSVLFRSDEEAMLNDVVNTVMCHYCEARKGQPCRMPSRWKYRRVHSIRRRVYDRRTR